MVIAELAKSVSVTIQLVWLQVGFLYLVHKAMKKSAGEDGGFGRYFGVGSIP